MSTNPNFDSFNMVTSEQTFYEQPICQLLIPQILKQIICTNSFARKSSLKNVDKIDKTLIKNLICAKIISKHYMATK
jgi:hypothetical protein